MKRLHLPLYVRVLFGVALGVIVGIVFGRGEIAAMPQPEVLGRNGSYAVFRKLYAREAEFRQYVRARANSRAEEELLAAKFVGRWPSGAPLVLAHRIATIRSSGPI